MCFCYPGDTGSARAGRKQLRAEDRKRRPRRGRNAGENPFCFFAFLSRGVAAVPGRPAESPFLVFFLRSCRPSGRRARGNFLSVVPPAEPFPRRPEDCSREFSSGRGAPAVGRYHRCRYRPDLSGGSTPAGRVRIPPRGARQRGLPTGYGSGYAFVRGAGLPTRA